MIRYDFGRFLAALEKAAGYGIAAVLGGCVVVLCLRLSQALDYVTMCVP